MTHMTDPFSDSTHINMLFFHLTLCVCARVCVNALCLGTGDCKSEEPDDNQLCCWRVYLLLLYVWDKVSHWHEVNRTGLLVNKSQGSTLFVSAWNQDYSHEPLCLAHWCRFLGLDSVTREKYLPSPNSIPLYKRLNVHSIALLHALNHPKALIYIFWFFFFNYQLPPLSSVKTMLISILWYIWDLIWIFVFCWSAIPSPVSPPISPPVLLEWHF